MKKLQRNKTFILNLFALAFYASFYNFKYILKLYIFEINTD